MKQWLTDIGEMGACKEAIDWAEPFDSLDEAWAKCEHGEWMLWLAGKLSGKSGSNSHKKLILAACECARLALPYVPKEELRPLQAIQIAEAWARGEEGITLKDVRAAAGAAYAAAYTAAGAAAYTAYAAAYTAYAAGAAGAAAYTAGAAGATTLRRCADIVRDHYPEAP